MQHREEDGDVAWADIPQRQQRKIVSRCPSCSIADEQRDRVEVVEFARAGDAQR